MALRDGAALLPVTTLPSALLEAIHFKLYPAADDRPNGKHHLDLQRLQPTHDELRAAARWARTHDPSEGFAIVLRGVLAAFGLHEAV